MGKEEIPEKEEAITAEGSYVGKHVKEKNKTSVRVDVAKPVYKYEGGQG